MTGASLARHRLAYPAITAHGFLAAQVEPELRAVVENWLASGWPLVVARQTGPQPADFGLPLPPRLGKRRLRLSMAPNFVRAVRMPLRLGAATASAPPDWRAPLEELEREAAAADLEFRVFGSFLWQALTGWPYVGPASDLDLLWSPADSAELDAGCRLLRDWEARTAKRADAEIAFPSGRAVAWREWARVRRAGPPGARVLAKSLREAALVGVGDLESELVAHCSM